MIRVMRYLFLIIVGLVLWLPVRDGKEQAPYRCLPDDVEFSELVTRPLTPAEAQSGKRVSVRQTLARLKARCKKGKLVDGSGTEIRFYHLIGCWGNPPEDYQEQLAKQERELVELRKKFTVIEISCRPAIN